MNDLVGRIAYIIDPVAFQDFPDDGIDPRDGSMWGVKRSVLRQRAADILKVVRESADVLSEG